MPAITHTAVVPYSASELYRMLSDFEAYPDFIPWCERIERTIETPDCIQLSTTVKKSIIRQEASVTVRFAPQKMLSFRAMNHWFSHLSGIWHLESLPAGGTRLRLTVIFHFQTAVIESLASPLLKPTIERLMALCCKRAIDLYGN